MIFLKHIVGEKAMLKEIRYICDYCFKPFTIKAYCQLHEEHCCRLNPNADHCDNCAKDCKDERSGGNGMACTRFERKKDDRK